MKTFETKKAPAAIGPYSQAKMAGNFVFASGQIPVDPATGEVAGDKIETQAEQSCKNVGFGSTVPCLPIVTILPRSCST